MFARIWRAIVRFFKKEEIQRPDQVVDPIKPVENSDARIRLRNAALALMGKVFEIPGEVNNQLIQDMHETVSGVRHSDETPWCASAIGYLLSSIGLPHTNSMLARSYIGYGEKITLEEAEPGDIVVFERGNSSWKGHVGLYMSHDLDGILVLGGNQDNSFKKKLYDTHDLLYVGRVSDPKERKVKNHFDGVDLGEYFQSFLNQEVQELLNLTVGDIRNYFPGYQNADRQARIVFWKFFLSCMAMKESGVNPNTEYREAFTVKYGPRKGQRVISRGLFQVSIDSSNGYVKYGAPRISDPNQLHDPLINLECAIVILKRWIEVDGVISASRNGWKGGARYWSVLRNNNNHEWIQEQCLKAFS